MKLGTALTFCFALAVSGAIAQQPAAAPGLPKLPSQIQAAPRIVRLNVVAQDSHGQFVSGLRAEDFQIADDGKPQKIASFQLVNAVDGQLSTPLGPGEYSNRRAAAPATIILFDLFNADLAERGRGADEIVHALEHLESADSVYLYLLTSRAGLFSIHEIPEPGSAAEPDARWPGQIKPLLDEALRKVYGLKPLTDQNAVYRIPPTWMALDNLASVMTAIPGRKNFVWITQGVPNGYFAPGREQIIDTAPLRHLAGRFNQMDTVFYAVQQRINESIPSEAQGSEKDTLNQLAGLTGGRVYPTDNTARAITQAIADARMNYQIAWIPPANFWNDKYHKIRVTSSRKDLHMQTKQGYYATAPTYDMDDEYIASLRAAASSSFDFTDIRLKVTISPGNPDPRSKRLLIQMNPSDVLFLEQNGRYKSQLVVTGIEYATGGLTAVVDPIPVILDLTPEEHQKVLQDGIRVTEQLAPDNRIQKVRLIVLDIAANVTGSVTAPTGGTN